MEVWCLIRGLDIQGALGLLYFGVNRLFGLFLVQPLKPYQPVSFVTQVKILCPIVALYTLIIANLTGTFLEDGRCLAHLHTP